MSKTVIAYGIENGAGVINSVKPTVKLSQEAIEKLEDHEDAVPLVRGETNED